MNPSFPKMSRRQFLQRAGAPQAPIVTTTTERSAPQPTVPLNQPTLPSVAVITLNRMTFGPRPDDPETSIAAFNALGGDDDARLTAFVDRQLNPTLINDSDLTNRLNQAGFTTLNKTLTQLWTDHRLNSTDYTYRTLPIREVERATFLRAIYSRRQLFEVLAHFWYNHFNIYGWHYDVAPVFVHYDRDVIRANMLGRFRDLLEAVAKSTAMLYYLDNYTSSRAGPNENWAREVFELHTLGAENYLGVLPQTDVPTDLDGKPIGYVDDDVYEATRCFTGWTVANGNNDTSGNTGQFEYVEEWHDRFQKTVLGTFLPANQTAEIDGETVLDLLAAHPGTARHICRKLCRRFISDTPPDSLIESAAQVFLDQQNASDQLTQVVRHILLSTEFRTTWGEKIKRPFEATVSAVRAGNGDLSFGMNDDDSDTFLWRYGHTGQDLFRWKAPNGYPDVKEDWQGTTSLLMRWRLVNWLVDERDAADNYYLDLIGQTPGGVRSANALVDFWIDRILGRTMGASERQDLVDFMAQGNNPDIDLPLDSDDSVQSRLRALVALIMMSPEFQWR